MGGLARVADYLLMSRREPARFESNIDLAERVARLRAEVTAKVGAKRLWARFEAAVHSIQDFPTERSRRRLQRAVERAARRDRSFGGRLADLMAELEGLDADTVLVNHLVHRERFGVEFSEDTAIGLGVPSLKWDALRVHERVTAAFVRLLGTEHPDAVTARERLAMSHYKLGRTAEATSMLDRVAAERTRLLGADHPDTLTTRAVLALWRGLAGDAAGAADAFAGLLPAFVHVLGPDHPDTVTIRAHLAEWRGKAGA